MPKGLSMNERVESVDAATGARIVQLTSYPTPSSCLWYANTNFTPDSRTLILVCQREARRGAPWDLWRVDADGADLTQMTERDDASGFVMSPDGRHVYFNRPGALWRIGMDDLQEEEVLRHGSDCTGGHGFISPDGSTYYTAGQTPGNGARVDPSRPLGILCVATDGAGARVDEADEGWVVSLHSCSPGGAGLLAIAVHQGVKHYLLLDADLRQAGRFTASHDFAHCTFLGRKPEMQGCALPPFREVQRIGVGDETPSVVARGRTFWHSAASLDSDWIVTDTNWPDEGLQLIHVPTGHFRALCLPRSSQGHAQMTHPHPQFSPDGRMVIFNSDRTGVPQAYLAHVSDEMRELTVSGRLTVEDRRR
ncbi:MAG: hypothetical protein NT029_00445 [Armatimonadetes bacterium]|nr:hypothetical protein [Armatimonadota bacterium]